MVVFDKTTGIHSIELAQGCHSFGMCIFTGQILFLMKIQPILYQITSFISFLVRLQPLKRISDPEVRQILHHAIRSNQDKDVFHPVEDIRSTLLQDKKSFLRVDFGAGTRSDLSLEQTIGQIARNSLSSSVKCRFLYQLAKIIQAKTILEMGTSFGISTSYLAMGAPDASVITLEGDPVIAQMAQTNFESLNLANIRMHTGPFEQTLDQVMTEISPIDLVYLDGHHTYDATMEYFFRLLPRMSSSGIFIFDDIHWSKGMNRAWKEICSHHEIRATIDLYSLGLVFPTTSPPQAISLWPGLSWFSA